MLFIDQHVYYSGAADDGAAFARAENALKTALELDTTNVLANAALTRFLYYSGDPEFQRSAEHMLRDDALYELALDIEHNRSPVTPGDGSCIFAHVWSGPEVPVSGCTAFAKRDLRSVLEWLKPDAAAWGWALAYQARFPDPKIRAVLRALGGASFRQLWLGDMALRFGPASHAP